MDGEQQRYAVGDVIALPPEPPVGTVLTGSVGVSVFTMYRDTDGYWHYASGQGPELPTSLRMRWFEVVRFNPLQVVEVPGERGG